MAHILTDKEIQEIANNPDPPTLLGFGGYQYGHKIDVYSFYLTQKFEEIDELYPLPKDEDNNKGMKGFLLLCGIIDLTMWVSGFCLGKDYTVKKEYRQCLGGNSVDFRLTFHGNDFLCEAKNWSETTWVDARTYNDKIKTRFFCKGTNVLMILKNRVADVKAMYKTYSTINGQPINYVEIEHFMDGRNDTIDINWNLVFGVVQLANIIGLTIDLERKFTILDCFQMGMPNWFIQDYIDINERTVNRRANSLGFNRINSAYRGLIQYRHIG